MQYLGLALFAEGPTDHRFLRPLLRRLTEHLCLQAAEPVDLGDVLELHSPAEIRTEERAERIYQAAMRAAPAWDLLFVHTDGAGDPAKAVNARIAPAVTRLNDLPARSATVAVVPVRETEAWLLADGESLRRCWGIGTADLEAELPRRRADVEKIADPKARLRQIFEAVGGRKAVTRYYEVCGESISLGHLEGVPSFEELLADLTAALRALRILGA